MITHIEVSGFRSLQGFAMSLRPGLNVLVGPNGAGKTNILALFELLRHLSFGNAAHAVSAMGGANAVFRRSHDFEEAAGHTCEATAYGSVSLDSTKHLSYKYEFTIELDLIFDTLAITKQKLSACLRSRPNRGKPSSEEWEFVARCDNLEALSGTEPEVSIDTYSDAFFAALPTGTVPPTLRRQLSRQSIQADLSAAVEEGNSVLPRLGRILSGLRNPLLHDFRGGTVFNIVPSRARMEDDIARAPRIERTGSGIYSMLQLIERLSLEGPRRERLIEQLPTLVSRAAAVSHAEILQLLRLAADSIVEYEVRTDPFDNKLQIRLSLRESGNRTYTLPLSSMSDGVVKWLCLILIALTAANSFSMEEPENYLHPRMQQEFLRLLSSKMNPGAAVLVSTHSETLLNCVRPEDVVVVQLIGGRTVAKRPRNSEELNSEIERSGFGLGYYYVANAIDVGA